MRKDAPKGVRAWTVRKEDPKNLLEFLSFKLGVSRRIAKAAIDERKVWVDRRCVWMARHRLETGGVVELSGGIPAAAAPAASRDRRGARDGLAPRPPKKHVRVLWQDDDYLVCDKPCGMLTCGAAGATVENILRAQESMPSLAAVHRLDRDPTGCLLFAKNRHALEAAIEVFKTRSVSKTYHAIAAGRIEYAHQTIDAPVDGKRALTKLVREESGRDATFVKARIETGRTNQIRRHLASIRHPVLGDRVFGVKFARDPRIMRVPRQMLHASTLVLPHPLKRGTEIKVHSPLPADFRAALKLFI